MVGIVSQNLPRAALLVEKRAVRNRGDSQALVSMFGIDNGCQQN